MIIFVENLAIKCSRVKLGAAMWAYSVLKIWVRFLQKLGLPFNYPL